MNEGDSDDTISADQADPGTGGEAAQPDQDAAPDDTSGGEEKPDTPSTNGKADAEASNADPFSDEALATPDGIKAARVVIDEARESKRKQDRKYLKLESREQKFNHRIEQITARERAVEAKQHQIDASLRAIFSGTGDTVLNGLQQLAGRDPVKLVEELNRAVLGRPAPNAATDALQQRIAQLEHSIVQERQQAQAQLQAAQHRQKIDEAKQQFVQMASGDPNQWPLLAGYAAENKQEVADAAENILDAADQRGEVMTWADACDQLENQLKKFQLTSSGGQSPAAAPAAKPGVGRVPNANVPGSAQRSPAQSLTARQVASGGSQREMSEEEHLAALAEDPDIERLLGPMLR
jgi:hypothetical protein